MSRIKFDPDTVLLQDAIRGKIPRNISNEIISGVQKGSAVMKLAEEKEQTKVVEEITYMTGIGAYWVSEGQVIKTDSPRFVKAEMRAHKLAVIIPATREHLKHAMPNFFEKMKKEVIKAFHEKFDQAALVGVLSPWNRSALSVAAKAENIVNETADKYADINAAMGKVEEKDFEPNGLATVRAQRVKYRGTRDANGQPIFNQATKGEVDELLGLPVTYAPRESFAKKAVELIGDWNYAFYGILDDITYEILTEASLSSLKDEYGEPLNLAERDMIALKATMSVSWLIASDEAFSAIVPAGMQVEVATEPYGRKVKPKGKGRDKTQPEGVLDNPFSNLTTDELKANLLEAGIDFTGVRKRDDLIALLTGATGSSIEQNDVVEENDVAEENEG